MIMARGLPRGAHVQAVFEIMSHPSGLPRNIIQCLDDYNIPLYLSHTVTEIHGDARLTGVTVSEVDEHLQPIPGTEKRYDCDTLILSVGLLPDNKLTKDVGIGIDPHTKGAVVDEFMQTEIPGIFQQEMCCMCMILWILFPWKQNIWQSVRQSMSKAELYRHAISM